MENFFGGKDPFDHPFFTQPFDGLLREKSSMFYGFDGPFGNRSGARKQITIEELNPDNGPSKEVSAEKDSNDYPTGTQSFSFQRTAYGGPDGVYYTSSVGRRTGGDGVFLMEMKEDDRMIGESLHTFSKGIHDKDGLFIFVVKMLKPQEGLCNSEENWVHCNFGRTARVIGGHSVTTSQFSDGKVNYMETLHNLQDDELPGFQENWKMNAEKVFPGWKDGFNLLENTGFNHNAWDDFFGWGGWPQLQLESSGAESDGESQGSSSRGPSRKIVPVE